MKKLVDLEKLSRIDKLIRRKATGTPKQLAQKLEMSKSGLYEIIAFLKEVMYAPIIYSSNRLSYVYEYPPNFYLGFERDVLNRDEMQTTYGGLDEEAPQKNQNKKRKIEIEIDENQVFFDVDFEEE
ncbi:MAG: hypothetical protein FWH18_07290 [Marinilabiliaceae bacterium]|nr:hypothetical protein [Marinilabiliaceae bacterium]